MSIPTSAGFDMVIKPTIKALGEQIGMRMIDHCQNCGAWFLISRDHQDETLCIGCAGTSRSWDKELHNTRQREYLKKYKRVEKDRRRKEHGDGSNSHCSQISDQNDRVNDSLPMSGKEK